MSDNSSNDLAPRQLYDANGVLQYLPIMCPNVENASPQQNKMAQSSSQCNRGISCPYAHSLKELQSHPNFIQSHLSQGVEGQVDDRMNVPSIHIHDSPSNKDKSSMKQYNLIHDSRDSSKNGNQAYQSLEIDFHASPRKGKGKRRESAQASLNESPVAISKDTYRRKSEVPKQMRIAHQQNADGSRDYKQTSNSDLESYEAKSAQKEESFCSFLDLTLFKISPCKIDSNSHNLKRCPYYHDQKKDQRRPLGIYQSEMCSFAAKGKECPYGDHCQKAHNRVEEFYHPDKYKAKFCSSYIDRTGECEYGEYCSFAHSKAEISVELIDQFTQDIDFYMFHFKSVWCPYNESKHKRDECVYAHNWQDFRRKPQLYQYSKEQCPNWGSRQFISSYKDGCVNEYRCLQSHGWKEQEYHPENFKLNPCRHGEQCTKAHCPYYHSEKDRRQNLSQWFKAFPKTRLVNFPSNYYMPYLRNLTTDQDFMGGVKQTSFSRTTTDISFNTLKAKSPSPQVSPSQIMPQKSQIPQSSTPQQNFNINAPNFIPGGSQVKLPISNVSQAQFMHRPSMTSPSQNPYFQNIAREQQQKRFSTSPVIYSPHMYNQQQLLHAMHMPESSNNFCNNQPYIVQMSHQQQMSMLSPDSYLHQDFTYKSMIEQQKKRASLQTQDLQPILTQTTSDKRFSLQTTHITVQKQMELLSAMNYSGESSVHEFQEHYANMSNQSQSSYKNVILQSEPAHPEGRFEPRSPDGSYNKDCYKNINSEPKKKTLQVFASLHETDENQSDDDSSASSDDDDNEETSQEVRETSKFLKSIGMESLVPLTEARDLTLEQLQGMPMEELSEMVGCQPAAEKLKQELRNLKMEETWVNNLVDSNV